MGLRSGLGLQCLRCCHRPELDRLAKRADGAGRPGVYDDVKFDDHHHGAYDDDVDHYGAYDIDERPAFRDVLPGQHLQHDCAADVLRPLTCR